MVFKDYTFFSYVFLAIAVIFLTGHAHGAGLCDNSPNKQVCDSIVYTRTDPRDAVVAACNKLISETKVAKRVALGQPKSTEIDNCITYFDGAIKVSKRALESLNNKDYAGMRNYVNAIQTNYEACDGRFQSSSKTNPIAKSTKHLEDMASVGAYLANLVKWKRTCEFYVSEWKWYEEIVIKENKNLLGRPCLLYLCLVEHFLVPLWYENIYYS